MKYKFKNIVLFLGILLFLIYFSKYFISNKPKPAPAPPVEIPQITFNEVLSSISQDEIRKNLELLASDQFEGRMSGKKGNVLAAEFIKKEFESYGLKTLYHKFNIKRINPGPNKEVGDDFTQNIYAYIEGTDETLRDEIVVIGAHMDHIGYGPSMSRSSKLKVHPGADDNASGTVALLELAKCYSKVKDKVKRTVVFMAFSAEEMGLLGSKFYCKNPIFPINNPSISKHVFMLNMDMIGYLNEGKHNVSFSAGQSSIDVDRIIKNLSEKYTFASKITGRRSGGSDHAPFYNKKVPIAFLHTGLHRHYHTPEDTADRINYSGLTQVVKYAFELSWNVINGQKPEFNYGSFEQMELKHDHGYEEFPE